MGYVDLIPSVFRLTIASLENNKTYRTTKFNVGNKQCIGVTVKASQTVSVSVAYGIASDTAANAGVDQSASLPYKTSATSFASNTSTEGGTYHEIALPPHARQAQLVISNASGSTVSGAVIDAALRVVAYPAASGSGSSDFASITGWPGSSSQFVHADGSYSPLSAADIPDHSADKLTSGTIPAARLPGVLSNVDTQGELLSAAGAAAASHAHAASDITSGTIATARLGSGTADGTTFLAGDQTYKAPTATDSSKLPLSGGTMTGAIQASGTHSDPGNSTTHMRRTSTGGWVVNTPTGSGFAARCNGADMILATVGGTTITGGLLLQGTGGSGHFVRQSSLNGALSSGALATTDLPALVANAYNASAFAMSGGSTWEAMEFDTNLNADTGLHAASSSTTKKRFVATVAGRWRATAIWAASMASAECRICKNDVAYHTPSSSIAPAAGDQRTISAVISCAANDYATLELRSSGTGSMHASSTFLWEYLGV